MIKLLFAQANILVLVLDQDLFVRADLKNWDGRFPVGQLSLDFLLTSDFNDFFVAIVLLNSLSTY
jgi:hypothetical protein